MLPLRGAAPSSAHSKTLTPGQSGTLPRPSIIRRGSCAVTQTPVPRNFPVTTVPAVCAGGRTRVVAVLRWLPPGRALGSCLPYDRGHMADVAGGEPICGG